MLKTAHTLYEDLVHWRRDFHMHPELGFTETRTARIVADELEKMGYRVRRGVGKTGVVADIGDEGGPTIAIRADMDALPILETDDREYASLIPGVMHACGHDSHTSMALGAAAILAREKFPGRVRFLFQPSEETADDEGLSGAPRMIEDGALDGVDMVIAQHVGPYAPVGTISISSGPASGGVDSWFGKIFGVGGHGAHPDTVIDPFYILAHVIMGLNAIVSRRLEPFAPAVVSIGTIHGGAAQNVIPDTVEITGTLRYTDTDVHRQIKDEMRRVLEISRNLGGDYELRFEDGGGPMVNDEAASALLRAVGVDLLGEGNVQPLRQTLGAEDFGAFTGRVPGAMFVLGTRIEGDERTIHHPRFDIDERAMPIGAAMLVEAALRFLRGEQAADENR
ncbi:MAG: amidohydrolase [Chloroflexota bacterium]